MTRYLRSVRGLGLTALALAALVVATIGAARSSSQRKATFLVPRTSEPADCSTDSTLCLQNGRFLIEATWTRSDGSSGSGHPVNLSSDSGYFWFLEPDNVELVVKALNGCTTNGHTWLFAGGLTNLQVDIAVTDTSTGEVKHYSNPQGTAFLPITDTTAFGCPAGAEALSTGNPEEPAQGDFTAISSLSPSDSTPGCVDGDSTLCIRGRFQVEATWLTASGRTGPAHAVSLTSESGYFWFFDPGNVELLVKTLDACGIERGNWFFAAGLTTVAVELKVTDTFTGEIRTYSNSLGTKFLPIQDTSAFSFCPTPTPTPTATETPTPTPTPTSTPTPRPTRTPTSTPVTQIIINFGFSPSSITVHVGDRVEWLWSTGPGWSSSTTSGSCSSLCIFSSCVPQVCTADGQWNSGSHASPFTFSRRFSQVGTFDYFDLDSHIVGCYPRYCSGHYRGTVIVVP